MLVTVLVAGMSACGGGDSSVAADNGSTTSASAAGDGSTTSTTSASGDDPAVATSVGGDGDDGDGSATGGPDPTTTRPASSAGAGSAETMTTRCTEVVGASDDNADWEQRFQSDPGPDGPITLKVCIDDAEPAVGQTVTVTVAASDPDATLEAGVCDVMIVSWIEDEGTMCRDALLVPDGPAPTPAKQPGAASLKATHVYDGAGSFTISVAAWSGPGTGEPHPYESYAGATIPVTVH